MINELESNENVVSNNHCLKYDVFFCHASKNRNWVYELVDKLESDEHNFKCCFADRDFIIGRPILENIIRSIRTSKKTVLVLSPAFLESNWCSYEVQMTLETHIESHRNIVIPLMLENCKVPDYLGRITYIEVGYENYLERLIMAIKDEDINQENHLLSTHQLFNLPLNRNTYVRKEVTLQANYKISNNNDTFLPIELKGKIMSYNVYKNIIQQFKLLRRVYNYRFFEVTKLLIFIILIGFIFCFIDIKIYNLSRYYISWNFNSIWMMFLIFFVIIRLVDGLIQYISIRRLLIESNLYVYKGNLMIAFLEYSWLDISENKTSLIFYDYNWELCISTFHKFILDINKLSFSDIIMHISNNDKIFAIGEFTILEIIFKFRKYHAYKKRIVNYNDVTGDGGQNTSMEVENLFAFDKNDALKILLEFVPMYSDLLARGCLNHQPDTRHVHQRLCLCQFAESYFCRSIIFYLFENNDCMMRLNILAQTLKYLIIRA